MRIEITSILALAAMFVIATLLPVNMGALAFAGVLLIGVIGADMSADDVYAGFPGDLFLVLVGITYLFAIAQANGTIDWLVRLAVRAVGGRLAAIPWIMFVTAGVLTGVGAVSPAAVAILAPVALGFAFQHSINPMLMGLMVVHGAQAGGFSPISVYGTIVEGVVGRTDLPQSETGVFFASMAFNTLAAVVLFLVFGGIKLWRRGKMGAEGESAEGEGAERGRSLSLTPQQGLTLFGLVALIVLTVGFDLDVGLVSITVAVVLSLAFPTIQKDAVSKIAWPTVLLITGVVTYVAVLQEIGTIDYVGDAAKDVGTPLVAALLLCYVGAVVSAFASSVGVLGAIVPLAFPFLMQGEVGALGVIAALAVSSTIVDVSPFSTNGAIVLANGQGIDRDVFYKRLLTYGAIVVLVAPLLTWLALVVI